MVGKPAIVSDAHLSVGVMVLLAATVIGLGSTRSGVPAITIEQLALGVPGALIAITLLVSVHLGFLNLSSVGAFGLVLALLGQSEHPTNTRVLLVLVISVLLAVLTGLIARSSSAPVVMGLMMYIILGAAASAVARGSATISSADTSAVLRLGARGPVAHIVVLVVVVICTWLGLNHSTVGREARASALPAADEPRRGTVSFSWTQAWIGLITGLAAVASFSRLGVAGPPADSKLLVLAVSAMLVGGGTSVGERPSALRVAVAYVLILALRDQLITRGWNSGLADLSIAIPAAVALFLSSRRDTPAPTDV